MKKKLYLLFALLSLAPSMATSWFFQQTTSVIIASTLVLSNKRYDKSLSLDLHKAVEQKDYTSAQKLITNPQVDVNAKVDYGTHSSHKGWTPLIWCSGKGDQSLGIAKALLARKEINVNLQNNDGWTPLIQCSWKGDEALGIAKALLARKEIKVNLQDIWFDNTPLIKCSEQGDKALGIAKALLARKDIKVNLQNNKGSTPLIMCSQEGDKSLGIAKALLARKDIKVNLQNKWANTPLDIIIYFIKDNKENYTYVNLWNLLVAKGGILDNQKTVYENLNPNDFQEPKKGYIRSIKSTPPINLAPFTKELTQKNELLRNELEALKKTNTQKIRRLETDKNSINRQLNTTKQTIQQKQNTISNHLKKIDDQKKTINDYLNNINNQKNTIQTKNKEIEKLKNEKTQAIENFNQSQKNLATANQLKDEKEQTIQEQNEQIENKNEEIQGLTNRLASANQKVEQLDKDKKALQNENRQAINDFNESQNELKQEIRRYLKKISSLKDEFNQAIYRFGVFKETIKQKTHSLKDETQQIIQEQTKTINKHLTKINDHNNRIQHEQRKIQIRDKAIKHLNSQLVTTKEKIERQSKTINDQKKRIEYKEKNIQIKHETIKSLAKQLNTTKQTVTKKEQENNLLRKEIKKLRRNFDEELSLDLCDAIDDNDYTLAEKLINNPKVDINIKDENGLTPLLWCCWHGDTSLKITKLLLRHSDIEIDVKDHYKKNALHHICLKGALHSLELFLKQSAMNALLNEEDDKQQTPLDVVFDQVTGKHSDTKYVAAWSMLVVQGAVLNIHRKRYQHLNPSKFEDPQKTYVRLIKQNPPKNCSNSKFMEDEEDTKDDE